MKDSKKRKEIAPVLQGLKEYLDNHYMEEILQEIKAAMTLGQVEELDTDCRAGEIIAIARDLKARYGKAPSVVAHGRTVVAAAHAYAAAKDVVGSVEMVNAPLSWAESVRTHAMCDYAVAVHGGLLHYDWTDLLPQHICGKSGIIQGQKNK